MRGIVMTSALLGLASSSWADQRPVDFNRDIRPILSENCFKCHGPDEKERKAKLRLDDRAAALARPGVIEPGNANGSELIARVTARDAKERMPPEKTGKRLTESQITLLRRWIDEGAKYTLHWSFTPVQRPAVPEPTNSRWSRNDVDRFILARLESNGMSPNPQADRATLLRRLTLDLTGLPPTLADQDRFLADLEPQAWERLVDRVLASPRFGERLAVDWLDAARYADTHGYHIDSGRNMTQWREWVIRAFNTNKPFDQFTIEQLAGDLLPNPTLDQRVASGFNRNHMINFEGGAIPDEYHTAYIVDRVNTTGTVWLGLSIGCAQCHDHKYDPISQREYYSLFAFFNNVPENGLDGSKGNAMPFVRSPSPEQERRLAELDAEIGAVESALAKPAGDLEAEQAAWERSGPKALPEPVQQALSVPKEKRSEADLATIRNHFRKSESATAKGKARLATLKKQRTDLERAIPSTMVMQEMAKPRDTFILVRGQYDKRGEKVKAMAPAALPPIRGPLNRLGLAQWLVSGEHPLTARVTVNRFWQMLFGTGLVKTSEDFGSQGEWPSHPELLDWLADEFVKSRWDMKQLVRLMVTSATYQQSARVTPEQMAKDPENRLLGRAPRLRLSAEFIRDQALAASGLMNGEIGGASVFPYQPAGLWEELMSRADGANWTAQTYTPSHGKDLYRRSMYTFWKRTSPPAQLATFDAPDRETCTVRRARTNTPLQALILLNDPTYVEASRALAEQLLRISGTDDDRITLAFRLVVSRPPRPEELAIVRQFLTRQRARFSGDPAAAKKLLSVGESPRNTSLNEAEHAAWTTVSSMILNLDETVTRG